MNPIDYSKATIAQCLVQLESCDFQCVAGPLSMNLAFQRLVQLSKPVWRVSTYSGFEQWTRMNAGERSRQCDGDIALGIFMGGKKDVCAYVGGMAVYELEIIPHDFEITHVTPEMAAAEHERLAKIAELEAQLAALKKTK
jgi:hypothetical protein